MKKLLVIALLFAGCEPPNTIKTPELKVTPILTGSRFEVREVATFTDYSAYGNERKVFLVIDHENETEFVGITGVGISETGSHIENKDIVSDER